MSMQDLCNKLHLINLKTALNEKLKEQIDEHMFIDDEGFSRIILMWVVIKPTYTMDLAYEFFNNILTFKVQIRFKDFNYTLSNNFHFSIQEAKDFHMVTRFSASTIESCLIKGNKELKKAAFSLATLQKRMKKNG
jgi:phage anti-repressor protein